MSFIDDHLVPFLMLSLRSCSRPVSTSVAKRFSSVNNSFTRSLPGKVFTEPKYYELERKHLLGPSWQLVGTESQLVTNNTKAPASYFAETVCGWPTIVVKGAKTGQINAYHNVCRHKGGPLEWNNTAGTCDLNGLKCKYHGWAYSLDGKLLGVPAFGESCAGKLDRSEFNLWPMRVASWRGLIFVQALPNSPEDPSAGAPMTGPEADAAFVKANKAFCDRLSGVGITASTASSSAVPLEEFSFHSAKSHTLKCNWKLYLENYLEGYHIPHIHPELNKQVDMKEYQVLVRDGYVEHVSPTPAGVVSSYDGVWLWHHPTLAVNYYGTGLSLERIVPTGPNTTEIRYIYLFRKEAGGSVEEGQRKAADAIAMSTEVTGEDISVVEAVQAAMEGGGYSSPGCLSPRHEAGVGYFQGLVRQAHLKGGAVY